ncbi:MAG TPA: histidine kinase [Cyclobacteriaceae bacterium]|nr:histidine kinase [Cyclobacteriaceae bacterium]
MQRFLRYKADHILFWVVTIGFHAYTRLALVPQAGFGQFFGEVVVRNGLLASVIYANLLFLIPRYARKGKWGHYILFLFISFLFYVTLKNIHDVYLQGYMMGKAEYFDFFHNTFYNFSIALFYMAFSIALHLSREWFIQQELIRKIELEKLNTELEYLKAQINPHFLFNSLNTIFFQIDRQNSKARDTLSSFSEMLRYQLYECNGHAIPVEKEMAYLQNYVDLQRHRLDDHYWVSFTLNSVSNFSIAPLLLIPFVENAFKHVSHMPKDNEIRIDLWRKGNALRMMVFNTCNPQQMTKSNGHGIGLKNVQRRLDLLYSDRYNLQFQQKPGSFQVNLEITIE